MAYAEYNYRIINNFPLDGSSVIYINERVSRTNALRCFCIHQNQAGHSFDHTYTVTDPNGDTQKVQLCEAQVFFDGLLSWSNVTYYGLSVWLTISSYLLRLIVSLVVYMVGFTSRSFTLLFIISAICLVYFVNYCFIYTSAPLYYTDNKI